MKIFERLILVIGIATMGYLLWKFHPEQIWAIASQISFGFFAILAYQLCDQTFNALAWRFSFSTNDSKKVSFLPLLWGRLAGDGVNYLTPSGTVAGEFVRPGILGNILNEESRNSSVAIAKFAQSLGQVIFIFLGFAFILPNYVSFLHGKPLYIAVGLSLAAILFLLGSLAAALSERFFSIVSRFGPGVESKIGAMRKLMKSYLLQHPLRWILAILFFILGYASGAVEVFLICYFLKIPMGIKLSLAVEILSNVIDSVLFFVPAKIGTQEAGKTAIFALLGYPAAQGLAFGLIRHAREFFWAAVGFLIFALKRRNGYRPLKPAESPIS